MTTRLAFLLLLLSPAFYSAAAQSPGVTGSIGVDSAHVGRLALFVLAGQSNMSGRGALTSIAPPDPHIYVFGNDYRWQPATEPVDSPTGQVDAVSLDSDAGVGPARAFADALRAAHPDLLIGLIPCAKGSTIIEEWQRSPDDATLYGSCLKRVRAASPMGRLAGMLFLQGESDAHSGEMYHGVPRRPDTWAAHFTRFVHDFRRDTGKPELPVVFAQIGPHTSPERYVNWEQVQEEQARVALPTAQMITTTDLALQDRVHYDTPSYRTLGRRFAMAMAGLLGPLAGFDLQGHRGARGLRPENTIPAFQRALELGVTTLEMDVVVSRDGQVVLSHEPWFSSDICTTPGGDPVPPGSEREHNMHTLTYAEIARYDCGLRGNPRFPEQERMAVAKPLLSSVIEMAEAYPRAPGQGAIHYNIEIKSSPARDSVFTPLPGAYARALYDVLVHHGVLARATVQSFDPRALEATRRIDPTVTLAFLVENRDGLAANLSRLTFTPDIYSPDYRLLDQAMVEAAHRRGMQVIPWTVNDIDAMRAIKALGVDGLITDYPDRARTALGLD